MFPLLASCSLAAPTTEAPPEGRVWAVPGEPACRVTFPGGGFAAKRYNLALGKDGSVTWFLDSDCANAVMHARPGKVAMHEQILPPGSCKTVEEGALWAVCVRHNGDLTYLNVAVAGGSYMVPVAAPPGAPSAGYRHIEMTNTAMCGVNDDGLSCWSLPPYDERPAPPSGLHPERVLSDNLTVCADLGGEVLPCWKGEEETARPIPLHARDVAIDGANTCVLDAEGLVTCTLRPPTAWPADRMTDIDIGSGAGSCGLREDGAVVCWVAGEAPFFFVAGDGSKFTDIQGGCGVREDGRIECWDVSYRPPGPK